MKIKQYINERPKLKKALKITAVIGAIFSVGLNILVFGSLAVSCSQVKANETIEKQAPIKSVYRNKDYDCNIYYYASDLGSTDFYKGIFDVYNTTEDGEWFPIYFTDMLNAPSGDWETLVFTTTNSSSLPLGFVLEWNEFTTPALMENYNNVNKAFNRIKFTITNIASYTFSYGSLRIITFTCQLMNGAGTSLLTINSASKFYLNSNGGVTFYEVVPLSEYNTYVLTNKTIHDGFGSDTLANDIFDQFFMQSTTYKAGYEAGYKVGYDKGFNYEDGQSSAFSVITNAFNAVAGFMNIQVLPHLTLGVLLMAPIIVTLIIVIIKMFRG